MIRSLLTSFVLAITLSASLAGDAKVTELKAGSFTFKVPAPWVAKAEPRMMSAGGFNLPGKEGADPVEADFYHFGAGGGGGIEANIKRWQSQFTPGADGKPPVMEREELTFGTDKALLISIKGTFLSGPAMSPTKIPKPGYAMLGAILQSKQGDVFIKITGPEASTMATKDQVKNLVKDAFAR